MRLRPTVAAHPLLFGSILLALVGLTVFVLAYFEPQKLFIDDRVNEPLPTLSAAPRHAGSADAERGRRASPAERIRVVASGPFQGYEHSTSGRARVLRLAVRLPLPALRALRDLQRTRPPRLPLGGPSGRGRRRVRRLLRRARRAEGKHRPAELRHSHRPAPRRLPQRGRLVQALQRRLRRRPARLRRARWED